MPTAFVSLVEGYGIPGHNPAHDLAQGSNSGPKQGMCVVWNKGPGVTLGLSRLKDIGKPLKK